MYLKIEIVDSFGLFKSLQSIVSNLNFNNLQNSVGASKNSLLCRSTANSLKLLFDTFVTSRSSVIYVLFKVDYKSSQRGKIERMTSKSHFFEKFLRLQWSKKKVPIPELLSIFLDICHHLLTHNFIVSGSWWSPIILLHGTTATKNILMLFL